MEFKLVEDLRLITIPVTTCLLILITYIIFGAVLFAAWEGWNYMDGAYFCFTSLMTIGFGDFVALQQQRSLTLRPGYVVAR